MIPRPIAVQITKTISVSLFVYLILFSYIGLRYEQFSLFIANKALAGTAGALLALVLVTGPMSRVYSKLSFLMMYRKWLGMISFIYAYLHGMITLFGLPDYFPLSRFNLGNAAFICASISLLILILLFLLSFDIFIGSLNRKLWWSIHNWGLRVSVLFGFIHVVLVKYKTWITWFLHQDKGIGGMLPPAGLLISVWIICVFGIRLLEYRGRAQAQKIFPLFIAVFLLISLGIILGGVFYNTEV